MIASSNTIERWSAMAGEDADVRLHIDFDTFVRETYPVLVGVATASTGRRADANWWRRRRTEATYVLSGTVRSDLTRARSALASLLGE